MEVMENAYELVVNDYELKENVCELKENDVFWMKCLHDDMWKTKTFNCFFIIITSFILLISIIIKLISYYSAIILNIEMTNLIVK